MLCRSRRRRRSRCRCRSCLLPWRRSCLPRCGCRRGSRRRSGRMKFRACLRCRPRLGHRTILLPRLRLWLLRPGGRSRPVFRPRLSRRLLRCRAGELRLRSLRRRGPILHRASLRNLWRTGPILLPRLRHLLRLGPPRFRPVGLNLRSHLLRGGPRFRRSRRNYRRMSLNLIRTRCRSVIRRR
jgi:hypothetical protein